MGGAGQLGGRGSATRGADDCFCFVSIFYILFYFLFLFFASFSFLMLDARGGNPQEKTTVSFNAHEEIPRAIVEPFFP